VGLHGLAKTVLQGFAQHLLAHARAMLARHRGKRRLARTEAVHLDASREPLEAALHFGFQLIHGHADVQPARQTFEHFEICLHR